MKPVQFENFAECWKIFEDVMVKANQVLLFIFSHLVFFRKMWFCSVFDADCFIVCLFFGFCTFKHQEKDQEILTLKQHIQILQQEHLAKISRIAELEAQLQYLKVSARSSSAKKLNYIVGCWWLQFIIITMYTIELLSCNFPGMFFLHLFKGWRTFETRTPSSKIGNRKPEKGCKNPSAWEAAPTVSSFFIL